MELKRSGIVHTLESLVAAILFLFLVVVIAQQVSSAGEGGPDLGLRTRNVVEAMDTAGRLRPPVSNRSLGILKDRVDTHLSGINVEVSVMEVNATADTATFSGTHTRTFTVNQSNVENEELRLWFEQAAAPNVSVNGNYLLNTTGTVDTHETLDIGAETGGGSNEMQIDVASTSTVSYSIDIYERYDTGSPPSGTDVVSTTYLIGGMNHTFEPAEVSVQAWQ
ncbi:MAG: hypothetical protein SVW02_00485 [Candidatus Nanohaloarchaea archaeon]|nr:hypothetical protein [Candidatus Nanohaloarchaea archaeon]